MESKQLIQNLKEVLTSKNLKFEIKLNPSIIIIEGLEFNLQKDKYNDSLIITYCEDNSQIFYNPYRLAEFVKIELRNN